MLELKGKYCKDCKVYIDEVEPEAMSLIYNILECPAFEGQTIRIMPDVHAGKGIVIGFTSTLGKFVNPEHVGCDIGCTVSAVALSRYIPEIKYADFEHKIRNAIKFGFDIHDKCIIDEKDFRKFLSSEFSKAKSSWPDMVSELPDTVTEKWISSQLKRIGMDEGTFYKSLGTVGGGNHFVEYAETDDAAIMTVHCGSRNFGLKVFSYWNKIAKNSKKFDNKEIIKTIKATIADKTKWREAIKQLTEKESTKHPNGYLSGEYLQGYMCDMVFAQAYAKYNHITIHKIISDILSKFHIKTTFTIFTTHNYIDFEDHVIRKGAVKAVKNDYLLIPLNMRDGILLCEGMSNEDWNNSAPHGAGRKMSRSKAFENLSLDEFKNEMKGIFSTSVCKGTLDESPMAYKDSNAVCNIIQDITVEIMNIYRPKINWKSTTPEIKYDSK